MSFDWAFGSVKRIASRCIKVWSPLMKHQVSPSRLWRVQMMISRFLIEVRHCYDKRMHHTVPVNTRSTKLFTAHIYVVFMSQSIA